MSAVEFDRKDASPVELIAEACWNSAYWFLSTREKLRIEDSEADGLDFVPVPVEVFRGQQERLAADMFAKASVQYILAGLKRHGLAPEDVT